MEMISGTPLKHIDPSWRRTGVISPYLLRKQVGVDLMCNWWTFGAGLQSETACLIWSCVCAVESFTNQRSFSLSLRAEASAAMSASVLHLDGTSSSSRSCFCNCKKTNKKKKSDGLLFLFYFPWNNMLRITTSVSVDAEMKSSSCSYNNYKVQVFQQDQFTFSCP